MGQMYSNTLNGPTRENSYGVFNRTGMSSDIYCKEMSFVWQSMFLPFVYNILMLFFFVNVAIFICVE